MATIMHSIAASTAFAGKQVTARPSARAVARPRSIIRCAVGSGKWSETMVGGSAPFGAKWDPLGFTKDKDENQIKLYREAEITHGRVCMLAALGFVVGELVNPLFDGAITGPAINQFQQVPQLFWTAIVFAIACAEGWRLTYGWKSPADGAWALRDDYVPGDIGFDPLGIKPSDPKAWTSIQTKELNNGRLAMIAVAGFVAQELVTGDKIFTGDKLPF